MGWDGRQPEPGFITSASLNGFFILTISDLIARGAYFDAECVTSRSSSLLPTVQSVQASSVLECLSVQCSVCVQVMFLSAVGAWAIPRRISGARCASVLMGLVLRVYHWLV